MTTWRTNNKLVFFHQVPSMENILHRNPSSIPMKTIPCLQFQLAPLINHQLGIDTNIFHIIYRSRLKSGHWNLCDWCLCSDKNVWLMAKLWCPFFLTATVDIGVTQSGSTLKMFFFSSKCFIFLSLFPTKLGWCG